METNILTNIEHYNQLYTQTKVNEIFTENLNKPSLNIYPNPVQDKLIISFSLNEDEYSTVVIFDSKGEFIRSVYRGLMKKGSYNLELSLKGMNIDSGIYFIHTRFDLDSHIIPFIKE